MLGHLHLDFMFFLFIWHGGSEAGEKEDTAQNCIHTPCVMYYTDDPKGFPKWEDFQNPYGIKPGHWHGCQEGRTVMNRLRQRSWISKLFSFSLFLLEHNHCWYFQTVLMGTGSQSILPTNINPYCCLRRYTKKQTLSI